MSFQFALLGEPNRAQVLNDCEELLRLEVANKSGLSGMAIKSAFALAERLRPGFLRKAINALLDDFVRELQPFYTESLQFPQVRFCHYLHEHSTTVASALVQVADARVKNTHAPGIQKIYRKLRPTGEKHVELAVPEMGAILEKYLP